MKHDAGGQTVNLGQVGFSDPAEVLAAAEDVELVAALS
jgi:hypothetical protein